MSIVSSARFRNRKGLRGLTEKDVYPVELLFPGACLEKVSKMIPKLDKVDIPLPRILRKVLSAGTRQIDREISPL
jgi:hypothetical protein